jgi:hypothetical protein
VLQARSWRGLGCSPLQKVPPSSCQPPPPSRPSFLATGPSAVRPAPVRAAPAGLSGGTAATRPPPAEPRSINKCNSSSLHSNPAILFHSVARGPLPFFRLCPLSPLLRLPRTPRPATHPTPTNANFVSALFRTPRCLAAWVAPPPLPPSPAVPAAGVWATAPAARAAAALLYYLPCV